MDSLIAALTEGDLTTAEELVFEFRKRTPPTTPEAIMQRGALAIALARAYLAADRFVEAEAWTLRSLQTQMRADACLILARLAAIACDFDSVDAWIAAARCLNADIPVQFTQTPQVRVLTTAQTPRKQGLVLMTVGDRSTLQAAVTAVAAQMRDWPGDIVVVVDGPTLAVEAPWHVSTHPTRSGQAQTMFRALKLALARGWEQLTIIEDDIALCPGALSAMAALQIPADVLGVSWFSQASWPRPTTQPHGSGLVVQPMPTGYANGVALTIPATTVAQMLAHPLVQAWPHRHCGDSIFEHVAPGALWGTVYPSVVQHMGGDASLCGNTNLRQSPTFNSLFDARRLFD